MKPLSKLKQLEREADIAALGSFAARVQLTMAEEALKVAQENHTRAWDNFVTRKNAYLLEKLSDAKLEEFVAQGMHVSLKEKGK